MVSAEQLVNRIRDARVLVIGDIMLDRYWFGDVERISPEAPVPVVLVNDRQERLGGAGNVAVNITALGGQSTLVGITGDDEAGKAVETIAGAAGVQSQVIRDDSMPTCIKQRIISRNQQLLRADFEARPADTVHDKVQQQAAELLGEHDVVVLSDYGKGALQQVQPLIELAVAADKPVLVDPKGKDFLRYRGASLITPNLKEFQQVAGDVEDDDDLQRKAAAVIRDNGIGGLLVTLSERGMRLFTNRDEVIHRPARSQEVYDVSGAGDTVIAAMSMCMATGITLDESLKVANNAAGVVVSKLGTATVQPDELQHAIETEGEI